MKKVIVLAMLGAALLVGCGAKNDSQIINRDYTIDTNEKTEEPTSAEKETVTEAPTKGGAVSSNDDFAYKIDGPIMDFDSVKGPYYIFDIENVKILDCTCKDAKIVDYSRNGSVLTLTLYSSENPVNTTYVIDTNVKSVGKLPMS